MEFKLKNQKDRINFEPFDPKESNLIKVSLHQDGNDVESIWACINDKDKEDYDNDVIDSLPCRVIILRNSALMFYPNNSWGWYIPIRLKGNDKPECDINWIDIEQEPQMNLAETIHNIKKSTQI